jgi:phosphate transport system protein
MSLLRGEHTTKAFDIDLRELKRMVAEMGGCAERQLYGAVDALVRHDCEKGRKILLADSVLDSLQQEIEKKAIATIATRQPMAVDLREVVGVLRIAHNIERIGDLAKNIAKRGLLVNSDNLSRQASRGLTHIMDMAIGLLVEALDSFAGADSAKAAAVRSRDEEIDRMYSSLFCELLAQMAEDSGTVPASVQLLFCAKNIERIGDHVTDIAESVYYMVEGRAFADERKKADTTSMFRDAALPPH